MSNSSENRGSDMQPEGGKQEAAQPVVTKFTRRKRGGVGGGATQYEGQAIFTSAGVVSINITISGEIPTGLSDFEAAGAQGDSIPDGTTREAATFDATTDSVTSSDLPEASTSEDYTVQISFDEATQTEVNGVQV